MKKNESEHACQSTYLLNCLSLPTYASMQYNATYSSHLMREI